MRHIRVGLLGRGKAGSAVADVLRTDPRYQLCWIARRHPDEQDVDGLAPEVCSKRLSDPVWMDDHPVDAIVDFSGPEGFLAYETQVRRRGLMLVTAISAYRDSQLDRIRALGQDAPVLASPNITLGSNYLIMAAKLLRSIAPFADVAIVEQHFREKPEISGTARRIAQHLDLDESQITSLRLGGIVGHHEVIFGLPHQTVRLVHESIKREAFGTGVTFALGELWGCGPGVYSFEDLLMRKVKRQLALN